jgi:hypothetical protein
VEVVKHAHVAALFYGEDLQLPLDNARQSDVHLIILISHNGSSNWYQLDIA